MSLSKEEFKKKMAEGRAKAKAKREAIANTVPLAETSIAPSVEPEIAMVKKPRRGLFGSPKSPRTKPTNMIAKTSLIAWWKLIAGVPLVILGLIFAGLYLANPTNMFAGFLTVIFIAGGGFLIFTSFEKDKSGFIYKGKRKYTGNENTILILARRPQGEKKDIPVKIAFVELQHPPPGARLHYVRNLKKHYYILWNDTTKKRLVPYTLPDKKPFPPELFKIPAVMQPYKDWLEYAPPSLIQKVAPFVIIGAMFVVGILMTITSGG